MVSLLLATILVVSQEAPAIQDVNWKVTAERSFEFDGRPYIPVGLHISPTVEAIEKAANAGITDVFLEMPLDMGTWRRIIP